MATISRKILGRRSQNDDEEGEPKPQAVQHDNYFKENTREKEPER